MYPPCKNRIVFFYYFRAWIIIQFFFSLHSTPLHLAIMSKNILIFDLLLKQDKLDVNLRTINEEHSPLYYALVNESPISQNGASVKGTNGLDPFDSSPSSETDSNNPFSDEPPELLSADSSSSSDPLESGFASKLIEKGCQLNPVYSSNWDNLLILLAKKKCEVRLLFIYFTSYPCATHIFLYQYFSIYVIVVQIYGQLTHSLYYVIMGYLLF